MSKETMKLALEALEAIAAYRPMTFAECSDAEAIMGIAENAIPALREALAEPDFWEGYVPEPVKPAQPYKGIADHINQATNSRVRIDPVTGDVGIGTPSSQPDQEPVAWVCNGTNGHHDIDFFEEDVDSISVGTQLYTTPPQRKPPQFPTMLRKMWSGAEVQKWINENWEQA